MSTLSVNSLDFKRSLLCFWAAYIIVTLIGIGHTCFNIIVLNMTSMADGPGMGQGYEMTKPWHPLYNIVLFTLFGYLYIKKTTNATFAKAIKTGAIWSGICIIFDLIGWVLIKHPWSLTFNEFYIDYQPWITLIYMAIFMGPVFGFFIFKNTKSKKLTYG